MLERLREALTKRSLRLLKVEARKRFKERRQEEPELFEGVNDAEKHFVNAYALGAAAYWLLEKISKDHKNPLIVGIGRDSLGILLAHRFLKEEGKQIGRIAYVPVSRGNEISDTFEEIADLIWSKQYSEEKLEEIVDKLPQKFLDHMERLLERAKDHDAIVIVDIGVYGTHTVPLKLILEYLAKKKGMEKPIKVGMIDLFRNSLLYRNPLSGYVEYYINSNGKAIEFGRLTENEKGITPVIPYHGGKYFSRPSLDCLRLYLGDPNGSTMRKWRIQLAAIREAVKRRVNHETGHRR